MSASFPSWTVDLRGNVDKDNNDEEHFKNADSITQSFARENTQNINDVVRDDTTEPARIRVFVSGPERAMPVTVASKYFGNLEAHIGKCSTKAGLDRAVMNRPCQFLVVEDFNTTGLTGDVQKRNEPEGSGNNFYGFFRSAGKSAKVTGGGSWGVGKIVNNMASSIGAFFGYSVRHDVGGVPQDPARVLMGRATLTTHELDGKLYSPDAFFAVREGNDPNAFPLPVIADGLLDEFVNDWGLQRTPFETGLSIVVPYSEENIDTAALPYYLVAETYGFVINGRMTLEIDVPGLHTTITADTLEQFVESRVNADPDIDWSGLLERTRLATWMCDANIALDGITLPTADAGISIDDYLAALDEGLKQEIHERFLKSGRIYICIPTRVSGRWDQKDTATSERDGLLEVVLSNDISGETHYPEYFRDWLRIGVGLRQRSRGERPMGRKIPQIRSLVVARGGRDNGLAALLRASEGISHARWDSATKGFKHRFRDGGDTWVNFAKNSASALADVARGLTNEIDYSAFPFLADTGDSPRKEPTARKPGPLPPPSPAPRVEPIAGGFSIALPDKTQPCSLDITAGYDVSTGNPFKAWGPADFKFEALNVKVVGGKVAVKSGNVLSVEVSKPDTFSLTATGFDTNRDLTVKAELTPKTVGADEE